MKDDIETPPRPPAKRRQLEAALPAWLAVWANDESLTPSERRRAQEERDRRKALAGKDEVVGLVVAAEGMTPSQLEGLCTALRETNASQVLHTRVPRKVHGALMAVCRDMGAEARLVADVRDEQAAAAQVVRDSSFVLAAPRERTVLPYATPGVWSMVGLARHRSLPVRVVLPDGTQLQGDQLHA